MLRIDRPPAERPSGLAAHSAVCTAGSNETMERDIDPPQASPSRFTILASAITSRRLPVVGVDGGPAYTDGNAIYVDRDARADDMRDAVAVHAALLAADSLSKDRLLRLSRYRRNVAERFLSLEVIRIALDPNNVLPPATVRRVRSVSDRPLTRNGDESLKRAIGGATVPPLPTWVGTLKLIRLLRAGGFSAGEEPTDADLDSEVLADEQDDELSEEDEADSERSKIMEMFSSPLSSPLSDAIKKILGMGRSEDKEETAASSSPSVASGSLPSDRRPNAPRCGRRYGRCSRAHRSSESSIRSGTAARTPTARIGAP